MPACCRLTYVFLALSSQLSVFLKLCIMNILLYFLLCQSCRSFRNVSLGGPHIPFLSLIRKSYHGWLSMMTSSEGPIFRNGPVRRLRFGDEMWNMFSFGMSPKCISSHCHRQGSVWSARVSLALVPDLFNYAVFIAIHDAYHGFGSVITAYSYTDRHPGQESTIYS